MYMYREGLDGRVWEYNPGPPGVWSAVRGVCFVRKLEFSSGALSTVFLVSALRA